MLAQDFDPLLISKITGLSLDAIQTLKEPLTTISNLPESESDDSSTQ